LPAQADACANARDPPTYFDARADGGTSHADFNTCTDRGASATYSDACADKGASHADADALTDTGGGRGDGGPSPLVRRRT